MTVDLTKHAGERPTEAAPHPDSLRAYLPGRETAAILYGGSLVLSRRVWAWITAEDWKTALERAGYVLAGGYAVLYLDLHTSPFIAPAAGLAWCAVAFALSPVRSGDRDLDDDELPDDDEDQEDDEGEDEDQEDEAAAPLPQLEAELVARLVRETAADHGWRGVHLDDLLARLPGRSRDELLDCLKAARIRVHPGIKLRLPSGVYRNRQGVRVEDLPPGLGEAPTDPAAGLHLVPAQAAPGSPPDPSPPPSADPALRAG